MDVGGTYLRMKQANLHLQTYIQYIRIPSRDSILCGICQVTVIENSFNELSDIHMPLIQTFFPFMNPPKHSTTCVLHLSKLSCIQLVHTLFSQSTSVEAPDQGTWDWVTPLLGNTICWIEVSRGVCGCSSEWGNAWVKKVNEAVGGWLIHWK